jgi:hypothetical protein
MTSNSNPVTHVCSICGRNYDGWGNNAWPINDGRCCDGCNELVIYRRIGDMRRRDTDDEVNQ